MTFFFFFFSLEIEEFIYIFAQFMPLILDVNCAIPKKKVISRSISIFVQILRLISDILLASLKKKVIDIFMLQVARDLI